MAKQRKFNYPSEPASFFDEMEEEMYNTKRKKCKRPEKVPPEKLFLQFDPSLSKNKSNSQPSGTQKTQWKPPIKMPNEADNLEPCNSAASVNIVENKENVCSEANEDSVKITSLNICDLEITDSYVEENICKHEESGEDDMENGKVINSSQESVEQNLVKIVSNDFEHNLSQYEEVKETVHEILHLQHMDTVQTRYEEEAVESCQKESTVLENQDMTKSTFPFVENKISTVCQDPNPITYECEFGHSDVGKISNCNNNNNIKNSNDCLNKEQLTPKSETLKENSRIDSEEPLGEQINNTLNPTHHSHKTVDDCVEDLEISAAVFSKNTITSIEKSDKSKIINENTIEDDKIEILSGSGSLQCDSNKIQGVNKNETNDLLIGSAFEDSCPADTNNDSALEILTGSVDGNENNFKGSSTVSLIKNSCVAADNATDAPQSPIINKPIVETIPLVNQADKSDDKNVMDEILEQQKTLNEVYKTKSDPEKFEEHDTNENKKDSILNSDCSLQDSNIKQKLCVISSKIGDNIKDESEKLLEVEKSIGEANIEIDEEYSCLMISNSQLEEIEKNYYETSEHTSMNEAKKISDNSIAKPNLIIQKGNETSEFSCMKTESSIEGKSSTLVQRNSVNLSQSFFQNISTTPQWPKNALELQTKIRNLTQEIEQLNTLLMRTRQTIWPQRHRDNLK